MKKTLAVITLLFLTNCAYKPLVNPETSRDKWSGENIAGNYYKDLQACNYIWERETKYKLPFEKPDVRFITKCMNDYGYSILR
tara:strand:+ start:809 stop:1057 length:249 start_codon:yes stop_codon:yes gene_type:complete